MKRRLLQQSLELATEIHALIDQVPEDKVAEVTEQVKTQSLQVQSHLTRAQSLDAEELAESLESAITSLTDLEEKMLLAVKQRRLKKMAINPLLAKIKDLILEIKVASGQRI